jgi:hypothetical protein
MFGLFLNAAILYLIVWLVARHTAELEFWVMFLIALGVGLAGWGIGLALGGGYLTLLGLIPVLGLLVFLLMKFCYISLQQALIASGIYFAYQIGYMLFIMATIR